jgi:hypothetical protein
MSTEELAAFTLDFVRSEFVPTLWALVVAALREPLTWAVIGAGALPTLWRRLRTTGRSHRP